MLSSTKKLFLSFIIAIAVVISMSYIISNIDVTFSKFSSYKVDIPKVMRVAHVKNDSLKDFYRNIYVDRRNVPEIGDDEVLVYVKAATFTQRDFDFFKTNKDQKEFVPCSDFSGIVVKVGKNVSAYKVRDKVFGITDLKENRGACADYIAVPQNNIYLIPYSLTFKQAAAIPTPALLDWFALHNLQKLGVKNGKVLIDDAISEVGIMLTGLLVKNGFEVTAIDDENVESWINGFGVKNFISISDFYEKKEQLLNSYDVVINLRHGLPVKELIKLVKTKGTFISFEQTNKDRSDIKTLIIDNKKIDKEIFAKMARLVHLGRLQVNIVKEFSLEHIRDAFIRASKGNINGKIAVNVNK